MNNVIDLNDVFKKLDTYEEVSYYIDCSGSKYSVIIPKYRVLEGSTYLLLSKVYCRNVFFILSCFKNIDFAREIYNINLCIDRGGLYA